MYNEDDKLCFFHRRVTAVEQGKRQEEKSWRQEKGRKAIKICCCFTSVVLRWEAVVDGLAEKI